MNGNLKIDLEWLIGTWTDEVLTRIDGRREKFNASYGEVHAVLCELGWNDLAECWEESFDDAEA